MCLVCFFYFILETIIFGGEILEQDVKRFATTVATYFNDPNPDWAILCTTCEWTFVCDFTAENCSFVPFQNVPPYDSPNGVWVLGTGWDATDIEEFNNNYARTTSPQRAITATQISTVSFTFNYVQGAWQQVSQVAVAVFGYLGGSLVYTATRNYNVQPDGNDLVFSVSPSQQLDVIHLIVRPNTTVGNINNLSGSAQITSITVQGEGSNPF